ncbi:MAG: hypothetical protein ACOY4F_01560 [Thermodesulfobacteriota bacterium]
MSLRTMTEPEKPARWLFAVFLAVFLTACSVEPRLTSLSIVSIDTWVKRNNPDFYIEPLASPGTPMTALIVPFRVNQNIEYARGLGEQVTKYVWQTWTRDRVFPKFLFEQGAPAMSAAQAVALARKRGVDLAVTGAVTYIISGGTRGDSAVSISMEVFDAASGERLWSMAHGGRIETGQTRDYIFFAKQNRMPEDPIYAVTTVLAADMGGMVTNWNYGHKPPPPAAPNPPPPPPPGPAGS